MSALIRRFATDFRQIVRTSPKGVALVNGLDESEWTYSDLDSLTNQIGAFLAHAGVQPCQPIVSLLPNSIDNLVIFLASLKFGLDFAPLGSTATPAEVRHWIKLVQPGVCLATPHVSSSVRAELEVSRVRIVSLVANGRFDWLDSQVGTPPPVKAEPPGKTLSRLFLSTSGTTGRPKALVFDGDRLWSSGKAFTSRFGFLDEEACFMNILPMSYLGGLFNLGLIPIATGGCVVVCEAFSGRSFLSFWQDVKRFEVNVLWLVPSLVRGLLAIYGPRRRQKLHGLQLGIRSGLLGTAPIDLTSKQQFEEEFGVPLLENYALSETTFLTSETLDTRFRRCERSVGEILPYVELRLVESEEKKKGEGPSLEIQARSPFLFLGYLRENGEIDLPLTEDGFLATGDLGHLVRDNTLVLDGRTRDFIKKGGYFISLPEIELVTQTHPAVAEAAAVCVPHDFYGETYVLFVRFKEKLRVEKKSLPELRNWITNNLSRHKWPQDVLVVEDFPRTPYGKIKKRSLVERLVSRV